MPVEAPKVRAADPNIFANRQEAMELVEQVQFDAPINCASWNPSGDRVAVSVGDRGSLSLPLPKTG